MGVGRAADRFWSELQALHQAAGKPTLSRLVRLGLEQRPQISISDSTINGWLNRKAVPTGRKNERYLAAMLAFLQVKAKSSTRYEPLSMATWVTLLREAQTERAASKKQGRPRRPAMPARGADAYDRWRAATAERIEAGLARGEHAQLTDHLTRLVRDYPLDEIFQRQRMMALYRCGQAFDALAAYRLARDLWIDQLGTEPPKRLRDLHQQMLNRDPALVPPPALPPAAGTAQHADRLQWMLPADTETFSGRCGELVVTVTGALIGRDSEMAVLVRLMREVAAGRGGAVLIEGEPGIGKSALVRAALANTPDVGCQVFWGAGDELGQALPLLPLLEALRVRDPSANIRRNKIVRLLRGEDTVHPSMDVSAALAEQLLALIAEQCAIMPIILVVDDIQWADQASVALWGRLAKSARQMPLLMIGMTRPVPRREDLLVLRRIVGHGAWLQLTGLTEAAVTELIAALVGGTPDNKLLRLADGAAGNPLYLTELVAALTRSSNVTITGAGTAELTSSSAPSSLSAAIADRLSFVPGPVREVLRSAALLGVDFALPDLAIVLGREVPDLLPAVGQALAAGVLIGSGSDFGFRHPLIRAALYEEIPVPVRLKWHRDVGRALAEAGAPVDRVARQLLQAVGGPGATAEPLDEWILDWLARTAELLVGQAPQVAAELLRQAVASSPHGSAQHGVLMSRFANALHRVGDATEVE